MKCLLIIMLTCLHTQAISMERSHDVIATDNTIVDIKQDPIDYKIERLRHIQDMQEARAIQAKAEFTDLCTRITMLNARTRILIAKVDAWLREHGRK